jgi:hypothetical protein
MACTRECAAGGAVPSSTLRTGTNEGELLVHPNIARLLDGGTTEQGEPDSLLASIGAG